MIRAEPCAGATEATDHLVCHEQDPIAVHDLLDLRPIGLRRNDHPAGTLDRLANERSHALWPDFENLVFQRLRRQHSELGRREIAAFAEPVRLPDMDDAGNWQTALRVHRRHPAKTCASHGAAVIGVLAADDDRALGLPHQVPVAAHSAYHGVVRLGPRPREEHVLELRRRDLHQQTRQLDGGRMSHLEKAVVVRKLEQLLVGGLRQLAPTVPEIHAPQPGHAIEDLPTVGVI